MDEQTAREFGRALAADAAPGANPWAVGRQARRLVMATLARLGHDYNRQEARGIAAGMAAVETLEPNDADTRDAADLARENGC